MPELDCSYTTKSQFSLFGSDMLKRTAAVKATPLTVRYGGLDLGKTYCWWGAASSNNPNPERATFTDIMCGCQSFSSSVEDGGIVNAEDDSGIAV